MKLMDGISELEVTMLSSVEFEDGSLAKSVSRWIVMEDCWSFELPSSEVEIEKK